MARKYSPFIESILPQEARQSQPTKTGRWQGTALIVESLIILVFVVACLAVFARLFGYSFVNNAYDQQRAHAITLATNKAETLTAQSGAMPLLSVEEEGGYTTTCEITPEHTARGILYRAKITVSVAGTSATQGESDSDADGEDTGQILYQLHTARYVSVPPAAPASNGGEQNG